MKNLRLFFVLVFVLLLSTVSFAGNYVEGEVLVVLKQESGQKVTAASAESGVAYSQAASVAKEVGASLVQTYGALSEAGNQVFMLVKSDTKTTEELMAELGGRPDVYAVSPNYMSRLTKTPNDTDYDKLWGMEKIKAPAAWNESTGSDSVYVAVLDTGIIDTHEDLAANVDTGRSRFFPKEGAADKNYADTHGHGTHVAGTIGAVGDNNLGVAGVNWNVKIIALKIFHTDGYTYDNQVIAALDYLRGLLKNEPNLRIVAANLSIGGWQQITPDAMQATPYNMAFQLLDNTDRIVIVVAAGNEGLEVGKPAPFDEPVEFRVNPLIPSFLKGYYCYPASFKGLKNFIVVGAATVDDVAAEFSNWGSAVHVAAPGEAIFSTVFPEANKRPGETYGTWYGMMRGTSMAAPHVAGAVGLIASKFPGILSAGEMKKMIVTWADNTNNPPAPDYYGNPAAGFAGKKLSANGMLDVQRAYSFLENISPNPITPTPTPTPTPTGGSSGSGCNAGFAGLALAGLAFVILKRKG